MTDSSRRVRAEAAFGHLQVAAREMIAAAHDALDLLDEVVTSVDLGEVFETVDHLSQSVLKKHRWPESSPSPPAARPSGPSGPVQRISVR